MCDHVARHWAGSGPSQRMLFNHLTKESRIVETAVRGGGTRGGATWLSGRGRYEDQ